MDRATTAIDGPMIGGVPKVAATSRTDGEPAGPGPDPSADAHGESVWYAPNAVPDPRAAAIRPVDPDNKIRPLFDAPSIDSPSYRQFLEALGVRPPTLAPRGRPARHSAS